LYNIVYTLILLLVEVAIQYFFLKKNVARTLLRLVEMLKR